MEKDAGSTIRPMIIPEQYVPLLAEKVVLRSYDEGRGSLVVGFGCDTVH
jgi:hypothetical protein